MKKQIITFSIASSLLLGGAWFMSKPKLAEEVPLKVTAPKTTANVAEKLNLPPAAVPESASPSPVALASQALDRELHAEVRWHALFTLTEQRPAPIEEILQIAVAPYEASDARASFEIRMRLHALEALDRIGQEGADVEEAITAVANADQDENIKMYAMIALAGIEQGRPGKLNRFLDQMINQESK